MRALRRIPATFPRLTALFLGIAFAVGLFGAIEILVRATGLGVKKVPRYIGGCTDTLAKSGEFSRVLCSSDFSAMWEGKEIFRTHEETDDSGRRVFPGQIKQAASQILLLGCSFTWGWGLEARDSLPAVLQSKRPDAAVWSVAIPGFGPHDAIVQLERADYTLRGIDRTAPTHAVFVFIARHFDRVAGDLYYIQSFGRRHPHFELGNDSRLERHGNFDDPSLKLLFIRAVGKSDFLFSRIERVHFHTYEYRKALLLAVFKEIENQFHKLFKNGDFTIAIFPSDVDSPIGELPQVMRGAGLSVLDYSALPFGLVAPHDLHPDASTVALVGASLANDLLARP